MRRRRHQRPAFGEPFRVEDEDNVATASAPVWRRRIRTPLTCRAVRLQLIRQASDLPASERQAYVSRRLTALDRALDDDQARALELWVTCEEMLSGRVNIGDYGQRIGGMSGGSPIPDRWLPMLRRHAAIKARLPATERRFLDMLCQMMAAPRWDFGIAGRAMFGVALPLRGARAKWIDRVVQIAEHLADFS
jgi:hypothetical protein